MDTSVTLSPASMIVSMVPLSSVVYLCHFFIPLLFFVIILPNKILFLPYLCFVLYI